MGDRTRSLPNVQAVPGTVKHQPSGSTLYTGSNAVIYAGSCIDTTMAPPYNADHNLDLRKWKVKPGYINGQTNWNLSGSQHIVADKYSESPLTSVSNLGSVPEPNWAYFQTKAIAGLDPAKPSTDLPLFLFEFKDFPEMLRHAGRVLRRKARAEDLPGSYLAWHFGWAPLVSDLFTLFDLANQIEKKKRFLLRLEKGGRFRTGLGSGSELVSTGGHAYVPLPFMGVGKYAFKCTYQVERKWKAWASSKAKLAGGYLPPTPTELQRLSTRLALGLSVRPAAVWEYVPWTWLIDYFSNFGTYHQAIEAQTRVYISSMCIMHSTVQSLVITDQQTAPGITFSGYSGELTVKRRRAVSNPTPFITTRPFLGPAQIGALVSLVTARAFGRAAGAHSYS